MPVGTAPIYHPYPLAHKLTHGGVVWIAPSATAKISKGVHGDADVDRGCVIETVQAFE
jgi:hypothetical protein